MGRGLLRAAEAESVRSAKNASAALEKTLRESARGMAAQSATERGTPNFKSLGGRGAETAGVLERESAANRAAELLRTEDKRLNEALLAAYRKKVYTASKTAFHFMDTPEGLRKLRRDIQSRVTDRVDYAALIPASAKTIFVGEIHNYAAIYREVEAMLLQYKAAYPHRRVYLLAESVSGKVPVVFSAAEEFFSPVVEYSLDNDAQVAMYARLVRAGVHLSGLELPGVLNGINEAGFDPQADLLRKKYGTLLWSARRNVYFLRKIKSIRAQDPDAVIFVYGGKAHFNYLMPYNVPDLAGEAESLVVDFTFRLLNEPIGFQSVWNAWRNELLAEEAAEFGTMVRRVKDPQTARLFGSDLRIELE